MENKKEMTAPIVSAATDTEQPFPKCTDNSISDYDENIKSFEEMQRELLRQLDPSYLKTVSMETLYDMVFDIKKIVVLPVWKREQEQRSVSLNDTSGEKTKAMKI